MTSGTAVAGEEWIFLGVRTRQLSDAGAPVVVAEAWLPAGASPPLHLHDDLDDSFYVLDGIMVVRCGDHVSLATAGTWVPFPALVPHTFRVIDRPARVLLVHANDSFLCAVRAIGHPARADEEPRTTDGPTPAALHRMMAEHGIRTVGAPMEADEAAAWMQGLTGS